MTVYFIGAGPGDPELITVKGQRLIRQCPVIIYAGSLVPAAVLEGHQAETVINSAELHLEQIIAAMRSAHEQGLDVARVHSGDPSLYGAIGEQIRHLPFAHEHLEHLPRRRHHEPLDVGRDLLRLEEHRHDEQIAKRDALIAAEQHLRHRRPGDVHRDLTQQSRL